ncbi:solute carrier family 46 member 3-like isoform X2 [Penaeus japonicus]|uniref:solute carrier family 46 member 3-like isoform X2 n=1 Tax=Penaeus japonicus TaxID=27405 RepID=UPI001C70FD88|nr:solute carrier family 46 member 3-like isoform X2 [Penaeus japonicus]
MLVKHRITSVEYTDEAEPLLTEDKATMEGKQGSAEGKRGQRPDQGHDVTFTRPSLISSFVGGLKKMLKNVTLEPMLFLKMVAEGNYGVVADTLEIDRVCRVNLNFSRNDCLAMDDGNHTQVQVAVQRFQNVFNYNQNLMDSLLPLAVVLFMGSLSDQHGRKPPMLAVLAGFVACSLVYLLTAINTAWPVEVLYVATFFVDVTGSWVVFNMAVYSYVADITTPESRTKRLGLLDAAWYLGGPLGRLMGGWLYPAAGYGVVFALSAALWVVCFFYVLLIVRESVPTAQREALSRESRVARCGPLRHVVSLVRTAFQRRPGRGRQLLLGLLAIKLLVFFTQGHQMYLWARRVLRWGVSEFSTWTSVESLVHQAGMVALVSAAARLRIHDALVALLGLVSIGLWSGVLALVRGPAQWWLALVASLLGSLEAAIEPALRTLLTMVVAKDEAGRVLALNGLLEAAWLTVDRSLFTLLYNAFVESFPQINFVVQGGVSVVLVVAVLVLWYRFRSQVPEDTEVENPSDNNPYSVPTSVPTSAPSPSRSTSPAPTHAHHM